MTSQSSCPPPLKVPLLNPTSNGDCSVTLLSSPSDDESTTTTTHTTIFSIIVGYIYAWVGKILTRILHVPAFVVKQRATMLEPRRRIRSKFTCCWVSILLRVESFLVLFLAVSQHPIDYKSCNSL